MLESTALGLQEALRRFFRIAGVPIEVPELLPEPLSQGTQQLLGARPPDEADLPLRLLREAPFRILVVSGGHSSGGHSEAYEVMCDAIAHEMVAERAVCRGAGHLVPDTGAPFNDLLERFLRRA